MRRKSVLHPRHRTIFALLCAGAISSAGAATSPVDAVLPAASWEGPGVAVVVEVSGPGHVSAERTPAALPFLGGVAGLPLAVLNPFVALTLPFFIVVGPPTQAAFNADAESVIRALATTPLPEQIVESLRSQWPSTGMVEGPVLQVRMRISDYGLATRSGKRIEAFEAQEELCLVADAQLELQSDASPARAESLSVSLAAPSSDAPPPFCGSLGRLAADDGSLLRRSIGELAEVLAAMALHRIEAAR